ncbi:MAG: LysM peptidoglycan-binding domain-containing protein [Bacillus sp. (in: Bacteria)]|nr:LysM peptidoglycan-binding domain-containing protein [Bacillus sp. (in: firmicutes)]
MKKLCKQYSYAITLIILSCSLAFILSYQYKSVDQNKYVKVTIMEGDSLWDISNQFSGQHSLSNKEFASWVKKQNKIVSNQIFPGEEIIIPVRMEVPASTELASAVRN